MKRGMIVWLLLSALASSGAAAVERTVGGFQQVGKTMWTDLDNLTEVARFPLQSTDPAFIVYLESLHPELSPCSREMEAAGECQRPNLCEIWVWVREDMRPVRSEPIQPDPSKVLVAWMDEDTLEGNGEHMYNHWDFDVLVIGWTDAAMLFKAPLLLLYAPGNQQCMAGVRVEYTNSLKALFNRWPG
jgi:hypothetical protein